MIFKQYLKLFLRNLKVVVINFVIFSVCILIFTKNNELTSFEKVKLNIVVNDLDKSEYSKALINYLSKDNNVTEQTLDENEARKKVFERQINAYINIKENFKENLQNNISPVTVLGSETTPRFIFMKIDLNKMLSFMETAIKTNTPISEVEASCLQHRAPDPGRAADQAAGNHQLRNRRRDDHVWPDGVVPDAPHLRFQTR